MLSELKLIAFLAWYIQHADNSEAIVYSDSSLLISVPGGGCTSHITNGPGRLFIRTI